MTTLIGDLPLELQYRLLLTLNYEDIMSICRTNNDYRQICEDSYFWTLKAKHDFGEDALIFPDKFTTPSIAYLELYSQYHLPINCEKYLSTIGCIIRAIEDDDLESMIRLSEKLTLDYVNLTPFRISFIYNYIKGIEYFGSRLTLHKYFVYGMNSNIDDVPNILRNANAEQINEFAAGAVYNGKEDVYNYMSENYEGLDISDAAYMSGKGGGKISYLIGLAPDNIVLGQYIMGLLDSGFTDTLEIIDKMDFDATVYLKSVVERGTGDVTIIRYLLDRGAKVNDWIINDAVDNQNFQALQILISQGDDLTEPLITAIKTRNRYLVKYLSRLVNVNIVIDKIIDTSYIDDIEKGLKANDGAIFKTLMLATDGSRIKRLLERIDSYKLKWIYEKSGSEI